MDTPRYPAARAIAPVLQAHFSRHIEAGRSAGAEPPAGIPDESDIEAVVDAAFWASLRREEGYIPKISLALVSPERARHPLLFERPLPLAQRSLVRIAPAVERPGIHLGVWKHDGELRVWGTARTLPPFSFVLEVAAPGLLVVKHQRGDGGKFVNIAVIEGDQIKIIDEHASALPDCPPLLTSLLGFDAPASWASSVNLLVQLAVSMRGHGRGGSLLVVPTGTEAWRESIVQPISYAVQPPFSELADLVLQTPAPDDRAEWQDAVNDAIQAIGGLTAVDGATVITNRYELLAFGAKIVRRTRFPQVEQVAITEPIEGAEAEVVHPTRLGGTRHLSAAQFVHDQRDGVALVASQDGGFTVFAWSPCEEMVHAHRVETLLL